MAKPAPSTGLFHLIASPFIQLLQELSSISTFIKSIFCLQNTIQIWQPLTVFATYALGQASISYYRPKSILRIPASTCTLPPSFSPLDSWLCKAEQSSFLRRFVFFSFGCAGSCLLQVGFSLIAASRGYSLVALLGLLIAVASHVAEHGLWVHGLHYLWLPGSRAQTQSLRHTSLFAPQHVGSPHARDWTGVPCIAVDHQGSPRAIVLHPGVDYVILLLKTLQWLPNEFSIRADHPPPLTMVNRPGASRCNNLIPA